MFIKNKRKAKYIGALAVTTVLTFTSCKKEEQQVELIAEKVEEHQATEIVTAINQATKPCVDIVKEMQDIKKNPESYIENLLFLKISISIIVIVLIHYGFIRSERLKTQKK